MAIMSSRTLRQCMLRNNKNGLALASPLRASLTLPLISASSPSALNQCGTNHLQSREFFLTLSAVTPRQANLIVSPQVLFHHTPVRRLYVYNTIVAGCLGFAGGVMFMLWLPRYLLSKRRRQIIPPISWSRTWHVLAAVSWPPPAQTVMAETREPWLISASQFG